MAVRSLDRRDPVSIRVGQTLSVLSGTKVSIECPVSGVPKPDVTWSRQDNKMDTDGHVLVKESLLIINNVTREDTGVYLCKAVNFAGEVVASSMVNVTSKSVYCLIGHLRASFTFVSKRALMQNLSNENYFLGIFTLMPTMQTF